MQTRGRQVFLKQIFTYQDQKKRMSYLNLQRMCRMKTCVYGGGAGGNWSSYSWDLPMA